MLTDLLAASNESNKNILIIVCLVLAAIALLIFIVRGRR